jgi:multicomponent Na+:H+ antiporter subunit B
MNGLLTLSLLSFLVVTALLTGVLRDLLAAIVVFGAYSLAMAITYAALRAPDVGLTEAAVGAGVTTALLLGTVGQLGTSREPSFRSRFGPGALVAVLALGVLLLATVPTLPAVGDPTAPAFQRLAPFYLTDAPRLGIPNAVTAVLVVYRGFDTFGEIVVVVVAGIAVLAVLESGVADD